MNKIEQHYKENRTYTSADLLAVGDKLKAGGLVSEVVSVRVEKNGLGILDTIYIQVEGQPEIESGNLQKFIDQGIEIIKKGE